MCRAAGGRGRARVRLRWTRPDAHPGRGARTLASGPSRAADAAVAGNRARSRTSRRALRRPHGGFLRGRTDGTAGTAARSRPPRVTRRCELRFRHRFRPSRARRLRSRLPGFDSAPRRDVCLGPRGSSPSKPFLGPAQVAPVKQPPKLSAPSTSGPAAPCPSAFQIGRSGLPNHSLPSSPARYAPSNQRTPSMIRGAAEPISFLGCPSVRRRRPGRKGRLRPETPCWSRAVLWR